MSTASALASGVLGGATTKLTRSLTRRAIHDWDGAPRLPRAAQDRNGLLAMLGWAAALGVFLALADVLRAQKSASAPGR